VKIHLAIPYRILLSRLEEVVAHRICPEIYFDAQTLEEYREDELLRCIESLKGAGLTYSLHAPFMDLAPGALDPKIRAVTAERLWATLKVAELIRPENVVFHPGYDRWRHGEYRREWLEMSIKTWRPLFEEARRVGIKVALENVFDEDPSLIREILQRTGRWAGFCFDPAHHLLFGKVSIRQWLDAFKEDLIEVHIHDNRGEADDHLPPGDGLVDFDEVFAHLPKRDDIIFTLEVHREEYVMRGMEALKGLLEGWRAKWSS